MPCFRPSHIVLALLFLALYSYLHRRHHTPSQPHSLAPSNSTLGFSTILAVYSPSSPRLPTLTCAANLIDLEIIIPPQPLRTDADIEYFRAKQHGALSRGSALAWLGHLDALTYFLALGEEYQTSLILEDDTDFSLSIRMQQIPLLAAAVRSILSSTSPAPPSPFLLRHLTTTTTIQTTGAIQTNGTSSTPATATTSPPLPCPPIHTSYTPTPAPLRPNSYIQILRTSSRRLIYRAVRAWFIGQSIRFVRSRMRLRGDLRGGFWRI